MKRVLVDTNVVARLLPRQASDDHIAVARAVAHLRNERHDLFLVPQVLYEFWVVTTRPVARNGFGLSPVEAAEDVHRLQKLFSLLRDERTVFDQWQDIVVQNSVSGKAAHDARLVAAMKRHALSHLLTFNPTDFKRYPDIELLDPMALASAYDRSGRATSPTPSSPS